MIHSHPLACPCSNLHKVCPWLGHPDAHLAPSHIDVCATVQAHPSFQRLSHPDQGWVFETQNCVTFEHESPSVLNHSVGCLRKKRHGSLEKGINIEINNFAFPWDQADHDISNDTPQPLVTLSPLIQVTFLLRRYGIFPKISFIPGWSLRKIFPCLLLQPGLKPFLTSKQ